MLVQMRKNFILAAMLSYIIVMLLLLAGINITYFINTTANEDRIIDSLMQSGRNRELSEDEVRGGYRPPRPYGLPLAENVPGMGPEGVHMVRFFVVKKIEDDSLQVISRDHIATVDEEKAKAYAKKAISHGRDRGYVEDFRYCIAEDEVLFLNVAPNIHSMRSLLTVSVVIGIISSAAVLVLVMIFSNGAIRPFARNIAAQKEFITNAGHELKTPLTSIATSVEIVEMEGGESEWTENIRKQTVRMSKLVENLVLLSRYDEESPVLEKEQLRVEECIWDICDIFVSMANAQKKDFKIEVPKELVIYGNKEELSRLISILLDNAFKYSEENGTIILKAFKSRSRVCIRVSNDCMNFDESRIERIFDRFYRMEESRNTKTGGYGIGLSIARAIAEGHGGSIRAQYLNGKSFVITVELPG